MAFYSLKHLFIIFTFLFIPIIWSIIIQKKDKILKISLITLFILELFRVFYLIYNNEFQINKDLSLQLCFTYAFIGIIYLINPRKYILSFLGSFGLLYGLVAIILTEPNPFLSFEVIHTYIYHSLMVFIGTYIITKYQITYDIKTQLIVWIQIIIGYTANHIIKKGSNYIFLNSFLNPNYHLPYKINIEAFNLPIINNHSVNFYLIYLKDTLGIFYYTILLIVIINSINHLWLKLVTKKL